MAMGVPKFYRWISERYPCLSQVLKEHQVSRAPSAAACRGPVPAPRQGGGEGSWPAPRRGEGGGLVPGRAGLGRAGGAEPEPRGRLAESRGGAGRAAAPAAAPGRTPQLEVAESRGPAACGRWETGEAFGAP